MDEKRDTRWPSSVTPERAAKAAANVIAAHDRAEANQQRKIAANLGGRQQREAARAMLAALKMAAHDLGKATGNAGILEALKVGPLARTIDRAIAAAETAGITAEER